MEGRLVQCLRDDRKVGVVLNVHCGPHVDLMTLGVWNDDSQELETVQFDVRDPSEPWYCAEVL